MSHRNLAASLGVVLAGAWMSSIGPSPALAQAPSIPALRSDADIGIAEFLKVRTPGGVQMTSDGTVFMRDWPDGIFQLYRREPGAAPTDQGKKITSFPDGMAGYSLSPDGTHAILEFAQGGNENNQVSVYNVKTGEIKPALANSAVQHSVNAWLHDSSGFIYTANHPSPRDFYIYRYDLATGTSTLLLDKPGQWGVADVTRDGSRLLVQEYRSISDSSVYELNASNKALTELSIKPEGGGTSSTRIAGYLPDEKSALLEADIRDGVMQLYKRDLASPTGAPTPVLHDLSIWEVDSATISHERDLLAVVHNEDGYGTLRLFKLPSLEAIPLPPMERGLVGVNDLRNGTLVFTLNNARQPSITYTWSIKDGPSKTPVALTARMDNSPVDLTTLALPQLVKYTSFDGVEIPAFLYLPAGAQKGKPIPFAVHFHGGPEGQWRPSFNSQVQYLVTKGYGVLLPNVRGSTGYGRAFHMMDDYKKRWDSVKDGAEAARWLVREGYAKNGAIAAWGGSYGGYMAAATIIEGADVFGASINIVGIGNVKTFLERTSGYRQKLREVEYGPLSDPEFLLSVSPLERIDEIKVPMLIAHGANDPRVPLNEAIQLAVGLQKRGHDPEILFFHDEGHGFAKLENRILFGETMVKFLNEHIGSSFQR